MHLCGNALRTMNNNLHIYWQQLVDQFLLSPALHELLLDLEKILRIGFIVLSLLIKVIFQIIPIEEKCLKSETRKLGSF